MKYNITLNQAAMIKRNNTLANEIGIEERNGDFTVAINLKKELYQNKLDMLSLKFNVRKKK